MVRFFKKYKTEGVIKMQKMKNKGFCSSGENKNPSRELLSDFSIIAAFSENQLRRKMKEVFRLNYDKPGDFEKLKPLGCCVYSLKAESQEIKNALRYKRMEKK